MIEIKNITKLFENKLVLNGINLTISEGETHVIIGKSGSGKSVLLKLIVGLLEPDSGQILIESENVFDMKDKRLYQIRTNFGFLFQNAALFDSLTVFENVSLPLVESKKNLSRSEIEKAVSEKLALVGLPNTEKLKPAELSGGMQKRVGLARALITNPKFILYDEPTTGLDPIMSDSIDKLISDVNEQAHVTSIIVTHDMFSVENVADKISMIHEGKIYFTGSKDELLNSEDKIIKDFIKRTTKK
jgi:phospholipid/cholesterol/gamma-HCH transport system ATP-binding protein